MLVNNNQEFHVQLNDFQLIVMLHVQLVQLMIEIHMHLQNQCLSLTCMKRVLVNSH